MLLARLVGRVGLAGEHELHRPVGVEQQRPQPVGLRQQQRGPLVGGEAAGEADRQRVRVEHLVAERARARTLDQLARGRRRRTLPARAQVVDRVATRCPRARRRRRPTSPQHVACRTAVDSRRDTQVWACTPLVIEPIGTSSTGTSGQRPWNISRLTSPCSCGDAVGAAGQAQAHDRHVEAVSSGSSSRWPSAHAARRA